MAKFVAGQSVRVRPHYDRPARRDVAGFLGQVSSAGPRRGTYWVMPAEGGPTLAVPVGKIASVDYRHSSSDAPSDAPEALRPNDFSLSSLIAHCTRCDGGRFLPAPPAPELGACCPGRSFVSCALCGLVVEVPSPSLSEWLSVSGG